MKVLQITPVSPPQRSGMANVAGQIYKATSMRDIDVSLVSAFGNSTIKDLHHYRLPGLGFLAFTPKIISLAKKADIIHLHYACYGNALAVSLARLFGARQPLIVSYHMDTVGRGLRRPVFWFHSKFLAPHFLRQASAIVVASRDYAEHSLLAKYPDLMAKVVEIPFGIDTMRFHPLPFEAKPRIPSNLYVSHLTKDFEAKPRIPSILFVGGLDEQHYFKGLHFLLEALVKIPNAKLVVVGSGNLVKYYARMAHDLCIDERVVFAGSVSDEELPGYYQRADVFCSSSVDRSEAYGVVITEAMASGLPVVATNIPGVRTVVKNNETGFLVKPGDSSALADALNSILNDSSLANRMGEAGRTFVLSRTWCEAGKKYVEIYRSLTNENI